MGQAARTSNSLQESGEWVRKRKQEKVEMQTGKGKKQRTKKNRQKR
jgi:hypothetical protein